jgi:hypothetical protein
MNVTLCVVSRHSSVPVKGADGTAVDLSDTTLPATAEGPAASRLFSAVEDARRKLRLRSASTPAGADIPLRLGLITTTDAGTDMAVETTPPDLQEKDLHDPDEQARLLEALRALERSVLTDQ